MNIAFWSLLIFIPLWFGGCAWAWHCSNLTFRQRMLLIQRRPVGNALFWNYSHEFDSVSYETHWRTLILFGNPRPLYGPLTQKIWDAPLDNPLA